MRTVRTLVLAGLAACVLTNTARAERSVMLITADSCPIDTLSMLEVRKAYFGLAASYEEHSIRAFRLRGDNELNRIFLQTVVAMSERSYERRLRSMLLKFGTPRPREFDDIDQLLPVLGRTDCGIAYLWSADAEAANGIKVLRLLWQGD